MSTLDAVKLLCYLNRLNTAVQILPSANQQAFHLVHLSATAGPLGVMMQCAVIGISAGKPLPARDEAHAELETDVRAAKTEPSP